MSEDLRREPCDRTSILTARMQGGLGWHIGAVITSAMYDELRAHIRIALDAEVEAGGPYLNNAWNRRTVPLGWQGIETAPRDGTVVLLWAPHWISPLTGWTFGTDAWQDAQKDTHSREPTHWMPLPVPPGGWGGDKGASVAESALTVHAASTETEGH